MIQLFCGGLPQNIFFKDVIKMLEYDEYRQTLNGLEKSINDLRDSL